MVLNNTFVYDLLRKWPVSLFRVQRAWVPRSISREMECITPASQARCQDVALH